MSEVTLAELATEIGVSKTAINQKLNRKVKEKHFRKVGNKFVIDDEGQTYIKSLFADRLDTKTQSKSKSETQSKTQSSNEEVVDLFRQNLTELQIQLAKKDNQIESLQKSLENHQKLLDQQQQLNAEDKRIIKELRAEILSIDAPADSRNQKNFSSEVVPEDTHISDELQDRIAELEKELEEGVAVNREWAEDNQKLTEELNQLKSKKWYQFWK